MSLKESLSHDLKAAMKQRDEKLKVSVIRLLKAAIQYEEKDKRRELSDEEVIEVTAREIKKRQESIPDYQRAGREETVKQLNEEIEFLRTYLPQQLTEEEIRSLIVKAIKDTGAQGTKDMGKVMKVVITQTRGRADGKLVNNLVKQLLVTD
ncbi:MAG: GatB/YqeY domain-containing protein [Syntrophomonadaceae bacterium]|nr:GatB/YqeY domain-containing protein [Syntrophomonadaceae bacterium]